MSNRIPGVLAGFKEFLMRGNVVELAVAVVVGAAFTKIVDSVVQGLINPVVGALGPKDLDRYESCLRGPCAWNEAGEAVSGIPLRWGSVVSATLSFLITAAVVYFLMILPLNSYKARLAARKGDAPQTPTEPTEIELLTEIRDALVASRGAVELGPQAQAVLGAPRDGAEDGGSATAGARAVADAPDTGTGKGAPSTS